MQGQDTNDGSAARPFRTISAAARVAHPGDVITVHAGVYRERIDPPRGGESDAKRITYQAAPGENVTITGSEIVKGWEKVDADTWKLTLPDSYFGDFNPYADVIHGDWYQDGGHPHHTGCVYLNGNWMTEAANLDQVLQPAAAGRTPLWFAQMDGVDGAGYLMNVASLSVAGKKIAADSFSAKSGELHPLPGAEGGVGVGYIRPGNWLEFAKVDFGAGAQSVDLRATSDAGGGDIELRLNNPYGELVGTCAVPDTGGWQKWASFSAEIKPTNGMHQLYLVFKPHHTTADNTTIWAQFPGGVNPNQATVEINKRQVVFYPSKTGINYITVRGFTLEDGAPNWAPPTAEQKAIIGPHWSKGWIIEDNTIRNSTCCGISLGKYGDQWDNTSGDTAEGQVATTKRALQNGWNQQTVGSHIVRNNHIYNCEQTGIVGNLGCSFSTIEGNDIHDIHTRNLFTGAEMAGIKFHGAIDVVIRGNHIYRCGDVAGIWLDWMAQGAQLTGNLMNDNTGQYGDIFCEMQHGPILLANNILLSKRMSICLNSQGIAVVHNLIVGSINDIRGDTRGTPFLVPHSTELAGMFNGSAKNDSGDDRFYNNLFVAPSNLNSLNNTALPCFAAGNVFTTGAQPPKFDTSALAKPDFDPGVKLEQRPDGWYLTITEDKAWSAERTRKLITTELLGKARIPDQLFTNPDNSPLRIDTDYFGHKRDVENPFPGPFAISAGGKQTLKVWPK
jgi:hypothetical protein